MPPEHSEPADYTAMPPGFLETIVHDLADPQFLRHQWDRLMAQEPEVADRLLGFANVYTTTAPSSENLVFSKSLWYTFCLRIITYRTPSRRFVNLKLLLAVIAILPYLLKRVRLKILVRYP